MWWNIWEKRRGHRSTLEQSIEDSELKKKRVQWEINTKEREKRNLVSLKGKEVYKYELNEQKTSISTGKIWRKSWRT